MMENQYDDDTKLWDEVIKAKFIDISPLHDQYKNYAINILKNNHQYIVDNHQEIESDEEKKELFFLSAGYSQTTEMIQFLINKFEINPMNQINKYGYNCLMMCCLMNPNLNILQYFLSMNFDLNYQNSQGMDCLLAACMRNKNPQIIKYLVENKHMDLGRKTLSGQSALTLACKKNNSLEVISYIASNPKISIYYRKPELGALDSLSLCILTNDLNKIKYFVEDLKMDLNESNASKNTYLTLAMNNKKNPSPIVQYLLESTDLKYNLCYVGGVDQFIKILHGMQDILNLTRFNKMLSSMIHNISHEISDPNLFLDFNQSLDHLNPLTIDDENRYELKRPDPFEMPYHQFTELADRFKAKITWTQIQSEYQSYKKQNIYPNFTSPSVRLFTHNQVIYYGDPVIVYPMIDLLDELECTEHQPLIELNQPLPGYIVSMYLHSCYSGFFNLCDVLPDDLTPFLLFIDKYPTKILSIDKYEHQIVEYMIMNKIPVNHQINELCQKYKSKHMYLYIRGIYCL
jgi:ankyrin repeat protein